MIDNSDLNMNEIAYAEWSCICVGRSYEETKSYDYERTYWIPGLVVTPKPPCSPYLCKNSKKWECIIIFVMLEEQGAKQTSEFIKQSGGMITQEQFNEFIKKRDYS